MPLYVFTLDERQVPAEQEPKWYANDVAALEAAAQATAELSRNGDRNRSLVLVVRLKHT